MKIGIVTICYNDQYNVAACVKNWKGVVDKHMVLVSEKPWKGPAYPRDKSFEVARSLGAEAVLGRWPSEAQQRNWALGRMLDYDYCLIVDSDEFFTKEDQQKLFKQLEETTWISSGCPKNTIVYWKTPEYVLDPTDESRMVLVVDPKSIIFTEARNYIFLNGDNDPNEFITPLNVTSHHFSYVRTDEQVLQKLTSYEHAESIIGLQKWYDEVWTKWTPNSEMLVRPRGTEPSKAIYKPAPKEIVDLFL